jgi:predicted nucleic acid-binding protein
MVIVDTTVWVDYLRGSDNPETDWLDREFGRQPLGLVDVIFCEVLLGVRDDHDFETIRRHLELFHIFETGGTRLAIAAARNYRDLRRRGLTIRKTIDCIIATFCLEQGHTLLHRDRDFSPFEKYLGLQVEHP